MKLVFRTLPVVALFVALLSLCANAGAANVVVGPNLTGIGWESFECGAPTCTYVNDELVGTGTNLTSPVTGAIVRFSVIGGSTAGTYRLRTANRVGISAVEFIFGKLSAPVTAVPNLGVQSYPTSLPITTGQTIGLTTSETASVGFREVGRYAEWETEPPESGQSSAEGSFLELAGFNAEIQPVPTVGALSVASGPTAGGTAVTITGTDLEGATAVSFGSTPATVTSDSETQITAVAPASGTAATVPVSVTTVAGTATGPGYTYVAPTPILKKTVPVQHCVVPNLKGKKLKAAKAALEKAKCKLGTVKKLAGATSKSGKVSRQGSKAGAKLSVGAKVAVTLKPPKPAAHKQTGKGGGR